MAREIIRRIIELVAKAQDLARSIGVSNLLQPGLVKEMILADLLGHDLITSKRDADACDPNDPSIKYEYLSCKEGGSGQLDRMYPKPPDKRAQSLKRIKRNAKFYFAVFYKTNQIKVKVIYELKTQVVLNEAEKKLDRTTSNHIGFSINWAAENGTVVYEGKDGR
jgi:hypothetical protein